MDDFSRNHFVTRLVRHGLCDPNALNPPPTPPRIDPSIFDDRERLREETGRYTTRAEVEALLDAMDTYDLTHEARQDVRRRLIAVLARWRRMPERDSSSSLDSLLDVVRMRTA